MVSSLVMGSSHKIIPIPWHYPHPVTPAMVMASPQSHDIIPIPWHCLCCWDHPHPWCYPGCWDHPDPMASSPSRGIIPIPWHQSHPMASSPSQWLQCWHHLHLIASNWDALGDPRTPCRVGCTMLGVPTDPFTQRRVTPPHSFLK